VQTFQKKDQATWSQGSGVGGFSRGKNGWAAGHNSREVSLKTTAGSSKNRKAKGALECSTLLKKSGDEASTPSRPNSKLKRKSRDLRGQVGHINDPFGAET